MAVFFPLFLVACVLTWVMLLAVVWVAQKLADFSLPPWSETLWKLAVISLAMNGPMMFTGFAFLLMGWMVGFVILWILLAKWLDMGGFGLALILIMSVILRPFVIGFFLLSLLQFFGES